MYKLQKQIYAEIRELNSKLLTQKAKVINANKLIKKHNQLKKFYESQLKLLKEGVE